MMRVHAGLAALSGMHRFKKIEHVKLEGNSSKGREGIEGEETGMDLVKIHCMNI